MYGLFSNFIIFAYINSQYMKAEVIQAIDAIVLNINTTGMNIINVVLAFVMFGVALDIRPRTFVDLLKKPKSLIIGVVCQLLLLPLVTFLLAIAATKAGWICPTMALGMILVASCPGGNISNFISSISKGNTELSVFLTAISTAAAIFATPANFAFYGNRYLKYASAIITEVPELQIPFWEVFKTIVILLGIPLTLGILCAHYKPGLAAKLKKPMKIFSIVFFAIMVVLTFGSNIDAFLKCIGSIFLVVLVHNLCALMTGFGTGCLFRLPFRDRRTLAIETGIQNSGLGLVLLFNKNIFPSLAGLGGMLVITAWWGVWHIISGLIIAAIFNKTGRIDKE